MFEIPLDYMSIRNPILIRVIMMTKTTNAKIILWICSKDSADLSLDSAILPKFSFKSFISVIDHSYLKPKFLHLSDLVQPEPSHIVFRSRSLCAVLEMETCRSWGLPCIVDETPLEVWLQRKWVVLLNPSFTGEKVSKEELPNIQIVLLPCYLLPMIKIIFHYYQSQTINLSAPFICNTVAQLLTYSLHIATFWTPWPLASAGVTTCED